MCKAQSLLLFAANLKVNISLSVFLMMSCLQKTILRYYVFRVVKWYKYTASCHALDIHAESTKELHLSSISAQTEINIYTESRLYGDILVCDQTSNCFEDSQIWCNDNYTTPCDITYSDDLYSCNQCLNHIFIGNGLCFFISCSILALKLYANYRDHDRY